MKYGPSTVAVLTVVRESEMGAFLDAETGRTNDDILLHKTQQTEPVHIGDQVKVFLYLDPKHRLTASMRVPRLKEGQIARMRVINVTKDGAFLDVGAERGIFMPYAGMRGKLQIGEVVWAKLYTDKSGRLAVTMKVEDEMRRASVKAVDVHKGQMVKGSVYNITDSGAFMLTTERYIAFIANKEMQEHPRVGQELEARVTYVRPDGRINASLREAKEKALVSDADKILMFLQSNNGRMPYCDTSSPELIKGKFKISKAAFKRALGHLYKDGLIEMKDGWTYLCD
ncbi:MAG: S1-like domain-containing RNA-binding protein [Veillonellaceae bacterium]|uniref:CvfB family protein n=1 Tax=Anaerovibrio lipolyticus TaxID=82374 RepID=UPI001F37D2AE|nr:S1-like domain-containing RNA-binding protein [Anaerovibrio lipolyticus]MCI6911535.1 S1-like domain-containing RNA-binding protein [Veillonellaceae bacterium]MDY4486222.1 S1-like domain-containing RNA-binding protein [Anaerovibrio sp.]MCI7077886.1 S1-like domain-containing RNA-binding protein [Veillonellaceae bacterium]MCI7234955.1 S1-like domain-containing RNA-binding protein [Veillonellaceae bacterium]MCI7267075.1 S1-like domain-containing RNA-binding protein [Veillonellaceae bacterium]